MTLSLCLITKDSAAYVEPLLAGARAYADEVVVAVDASSTDGTLDLCRKYADKLFEIEWLPSAASCEWALEWLNEQCGGDWILRLDDDELPSEGLVRALPELMADRTYTHYWLPCRWLVRRDPLEWIAQSPWWPDPHPRLFRNIRSLITVPGRLHTSYIIQGAGRTIGEGCIYHYDLVLHTSDQIRRKVERYDRLSGGEGMSHLYDIRDASRLATAPPPPGDLPFLDSRFHHRALRLARHLIRSRAPGKLSTISHVQAHEIDHRRASQYLDNTARIRRGSQEVSGTGGRRYPDGLAYASLVGKDCPERMLIGQSYPVWLCLRNESDYYWHSFDSWRPDDVAVAYHWIRQDGEMEVWDGSRTFLWRSLAPGQATEVQVKVIAPHRAGRYNLRFDLIIENVAWFSSLGWQAPGVEVQVESLDETH